MVVVTMDEDEETEVREAGDGGEGELDYHVKGAMGVGTKKDKMGGGEDKDSLLSSLSSLTDAPLWNSGTLTIFASLSAAVSRSDSDDLPAFLVTTHSYELPSLNNPETMALNLVTDMVFSKRR
ncbi:hypothetical protein BHM03_00018871 [Ensete ventricosum]|uniref:Uncharacterized protein n=1 Tax=Ensete ventricosum TaxID=4639 RepID=A0A445MFH8_ENSVE|nr:hypothetical protein BHM03_00018871 [Ensete ventricosum]